MNRRVALGLLGGTPLGLSFASTARAADPMRLAAAALDPTALLFFANEFGFFKNAGLNVDVQVMTNGQAVTLAIAGNALDVGCSELVSLILAYHGGLPLTLIATAGIQTPKAPAGILFARNDLPATTGRDFNGKTLALPGLNGFAQFGTQTWVDKTGGDSKTVKFIQLAGSQMGVALQDGRIDGAFVAEPFVSLVKKVARPVANSMAAIAPQFLSSAFFTTVPYAKSHPDEIRRFQSAIRQASAFSNKNPDQTAVVLAKVARLAPEIVAASTRTYYGSSLEPRDLQPMIDMSAKYGNFPTFPASDMIYRT
jgi:NitT/TauT family transport system substrate-binding protein